MSSTDESLPLASSCETSTTGRRSSGLTIGSAAAAAVEADARDCGGDDGGDDAVVNGATRALLADDSGNPNRHAARIRRSI